MDLAAANPLLSQFHSPLNYRLGFTVSAAICIPLMIGAAAVKFSNSIRKPCRGVGFEKWLVGISTLLAVAFAGSGIAFFYLSDSNDAQGLTTALISSQIFYSLSLAALQCSFLWQFRRSLFHATKWGIFIIAFGVIVGLSAVAEAAVYGLQCKPADDQQSIAIGTHECVDMKFFELVVGCIEFSFNAVIILLPLPQLYKKRASGDKRSLSCITFALIFGLIACGLSLIHVFVSHGSIDIWGFLGPLTSLLTLTSALVASAVASQTTSVTTTLASPTGEDSYDLERGARRTFVPFLARSAPRTAHAEPGSSSVVYLTKMDSECGRSVDTAAKPQSLPPLEIPRSNSDSTIFRPSRYQWPPQRKSWGFLATIGRATPTISPTDTTLKDGGIRVQTEVLMTSEERQKRRSRAQPQAPSGGGEGRAKCDNHSRKPTERDG